MREVEEVVADDLECVLQVGICSMSSILDYPSLA